MNIKSESFNSTFEFLSAIESRNITSAFEGIRLGSEVASEDFCGTKDMSEANKLMREGYDVGCEKLYKSISVRCNKQIRSRELSVIGHTPCVPVYLSGSPLNMIRTECRSVPSKNLTLVYDLGVSSFVSTDSIISAASKVLSVVKELERNNYRVNLYTFIGTVSHNRAYSCVLKIKDAFQKLNLMMVAYPLVHPSFLRRHLFKWIETFVDDKNIANNYYGTPISSKFNSLNEERRELISQNVIKEDWALLNFRTASRSDVEELVNVITKQLK